MMRWLLVPFLLPYRVVSRFLAERHTQTAAALSFVTLVGLVPMIAVAIVLISQLPFAAGMSVALEKFLLGNLLPEKAGSVIAKYVGQFAHRAGRVTLLGIGMLTVTALMQMLTIERTFNAIWKIRSARSLSRRLAIHLLTLLFGPLVFGASLAAISYLAGVSFGLVDEPPWLSTFFIRTLLPFFFLAVVLSILYWGVPNRVISIWHALAGGVAAALGFMAMQRLFALYIVNFPAYTVIYGAFAAIPIFLVWLFLSWSIIVLGALITAELPQVVKP